MAKRICSQIDPNHIHCCRRRLLPRNSLLARANYLTLTIVLVSLFTFAIAASSSHLLEHRSWRSDWGPATGAPGQRPATADRLSERVKIEGAQQRARLPSSYFVASAQRREQQERPLQVGLVSRATGRAEQDNGRGNRHDPLDADDEHFLRRLDLAGRQLDAKLAAQTKARAALAAAAAAKPAPPYPLWSNADAADWYPQEARYTEQRIEMSPADQLASGQNSNDNDDDEYWLTTVDNVRIIPGHPWMLINTGLKRPDRAALLAANRKHKNVDHLTTGAGAGHAAADNTFGDTYAPASTLLTDYSNTILPSGSSGVDDDTAGAGADEDSTQPIAQPMTSNTNNANNFLANYMMLLDKNDDTEPISFDANRQLLAEPAHGIKRDSNTADLEDNQPAKTDHHQAGDNSEQQQQRQQQEMQKDKTKYTTLLEDEENGGGSEEEQNGQQQKQKQAEQEKTTEGGARSAAPPATTRDSEAGTTGATYGKLVLSDTGPNQAISGDGAGQHAGSGSAELPSIFSRMYSKLAEYIPLLHQGQANLLRNGETEDGSHKTETATATATATTKTIPSVPQTGVSTSTASQGDLKQVGSEAEAQVAAATANDKIQNDKNNNGNRIDDNDDDADNTNNVVVVDDDDDKTGGGNLAQLAKPSVSKLLTNDDTSQHVEDQASGTSSSNSSISERHEDALVNEFDNSRVSFGTDSSEPSEASASPVSIKDKLANIIVNLNGPGQGHGQGQGQARAQAQDDGQLDRMRGVEIDLDEDNNFSGQFVDTKQPVRSTVRVVDSNSNSNSNKAGRHGSGQVKMSSSKRLSMAMDADDLQLDQMVPALVSSGGQQRPLMAEAGPNGAGFNLMRDSNLLLPLSSSDEPDAGGVLRSASRSPDSLLGKYIYAPTQHYYLHAMPSSRDHAHQSPQDAIYGAYGPPRRAYAFQKGNKEASLADSYATTSGSLGKTNDLYFLVMVGAFCVMAMAVVLSAGLFAYRVQQQRKTCQDTDYPTYGVVGPNSVGGNGGQGGAAAFVGGYFSHAGLVSGANSMGGGSKSASAKHLAELYANADSGINSIDKLSRSTTTTSSSSLSHKKSLTASINNNGGGGGGANDACADPQHQQACGGRPTSGHNNTTTGGGNSNNSSGNFMAGNQDAARMYHYQHQKQQMISSDRSSAGRHTSASDLDSEDENDDGSYTVYECPGLASAHEMEIKNPLFNDDQSP